MSCLIASMCAFNAESLLVGGVHELLLRIHHQDLSAVDKIAPLVLTLLTVLNITHFLPQAKPVTSLHT